MKNNKKIYYWILILLLIILLCFPVYALRVIEGNGESTLLYQVTTRPHDRFSIRWIHSVSNQPVIETYEINKDLSIGIYEMIFNENGPNLPAGPENGTKWEIKDGYFRVYNYNLIFQKVPVRIGKVVANHTLIYKNKELPLEQVSRPGGFVYIQVCKLILIKYIIGGIRLWLKMTFI